jgi:flagellar assembly protein FliH
MTPADTPSLDPQGAGATAPAHRRFTFDTVFDGDRVITPPKPKTAFTAQEVEQARAQGFAEGQRTVTARAEADAAAALAEAVRAIREAMTALSTLAHEHRAGSARLAMAAGRRIADAALDRFPEAPAVAALDALAREVEAQPRLIVRTSGPRLSRLEAALTQASEAAGFAGRLVVKTDPALAGAAFTFDWGEGRAAFDPEAAAERISIALEEALSAEGLHAEPLPFTTEGAP